MTLCHDLYLFIWETEGQREVIFPKLQSQKLNPENKIMCICKTWQVLISWVQKAVVEVGEGGGMGNMVRWAISLESF